jgi:hypothetical protein
VNAGDLSGQLEKTVIVMTDEPGATGTALRVIASTPVFATVEPNRVVWNVGEKPDTKLVRITASDKITISFVGELGEHPAFKSGASTVTPGKVVEIAIQPIDTGGSQSEEVTVVVNVGDGKTVVRRKIRIGALVDYDL